MSKPAEIRQKLIAARERGDLITAKVPGTKDLCISLQVHMVEQGKLQWNGVPAHQRLATLRNMRRVIDRAAKRIAKQRAKQRDLDGLHADMALWLAFQELYGDGIEPHLVNNPTREELEKPSQQEMH